MDVAPSNYAAAAALLSSNTVIFNNFFTQSHTFYIITLQIFSQTLFVLKVNKQDN